MQPGNLTGVLIGAVAAWIFGAIYYGVLGRHWIAAMGRSVEDFKAEQAARPGIVKASPFILSFIAEIVMGLVLYGILTHSGLFYARAGAITGAFCWFGFVLTTIIVNNGYAGRSWRLSLIDALHWLGALVIIGAVVGYFGP